MTFAGRGDPTSSTGSTGGTARTPRAPRTARAGVAALAAGDWDLEVTVRTSDIDQTVFVTVVPVA